MKYNEKYYNNLYNGDENLAIAYQQNDNSMTIPKKITPELLLHFFKNKKIDTEWSFYGFRPSETGKWTHNYHRYPAKFIPQLVEKLMDEYIFKEDAHINDPFMGCGTTIVSSISRGYKASGTDINKIAYLVTKAKTTPIDPKYLNMKIEKLATTLKTLEDAGGLFHKDIEPLIPMRHIERIDYWFTEDTKVKLGKLLRLICQEEDSIIRDFFTVAFSHILKNCSLWLQGSTKPTKDINKKIVNPYDLFLRHLKKMERGNKSFFAIIPKKVIKDINQFLNIKIGDAKKQPIPDANVDLVITSSPYVTSYEYADLHQLSTIWLDLVENLTEYKKQFIGTYYKKYKGRIPKSNIARNIVDEMHKKDISMAREIEAYFIDMEEVFNESFRILKHGGRCCYVIGDTKLKGVDILNAEVFAESLQYSGFKIERIIKREIPSKILPQKRDEKTGRFASNQEANSEAYPVEYIIIGLKE